VTRQGQGARQSAQDKSGKYAKSMGSQLRRYNEASLERDILSTLASWADALAQCDLVFVHAPSANAKAVFGPGALSRSDPRIRRVPFTTSRPTLAEVRRVLSRLASMETVSAEQLVFLFPDPELPSRRRPQPAQNGATLQTQMARFRDSTLVGHILPVTFPVLALLQLAMG
jgi:hypothetical protein